ncbi:MAG: geranylgeranylglyceryl/heptaprenylglyceryl phosphate synthase [Rhodothermia bacterium]|nr:geranylgeranylglyceryl/heptaprenylglyceryl phosphate synthase [Rhodothermia bacterium]
MLHSVYDRLRTISTQKGAGFIVLIDPDRISEKDVPDFVEMCESADADAFFVGSSILCHPDFDRFVRVLSQSASIPVVGFPGSVNQLSPALDAILFLSVVSSRNPEYLFGQHVHAAPVIRSMEIEPIATGYMLVDCGKTTTAQYVTHSMPLPQDKPDVAAATALAAEMMGMKLLFADGGSGAKGNVAEPLISAVSEICNVPLMVGGGLRSPNDVARKVQAGADFVVVGTAIEARPDRGFISEMAAAAHIAVPRPI